MLYIRCLEHNLETNNNIDKKTENSDNEKNTIYKKMREIENCIFKEIKNTVIRNKRIKYMFNKVKYKFKRFFQVIELEEIYGGYIVTVPFKLERVEDIKVKNKASKLKRTKLNVWEKLREKIQKICYTIFLNKIQKIIYKKKIDSIILPDIAKNNKDFFSIFLYKIMGVNIEVKIKKENKESVPVSVKKNYSNSIVLNGKENANSIVKVLDGNNIFPYLIYEILEYIIKIRNSNLALEDVYILANNVDDNLLNQIIFLSMKVKNINIVTENKQKFYNVAEVVHKQTENELIILNNKRKSLLRAKYIVNMDFAPEEIQKFSIYRKAVIINVKYKNIGTICAFDGICVNSFDINASKEVKNFFAQHNLLNETKLSILYEGIINVKDNFLNVRSRMKMDNVSIVKLYGNNGVINEKEFLLTRSQHASS